MSAHPKKTFSKAPAPKCRTCGGDCGRKPGERCRFAKNAAKQQADDLWRTLTGGC